MLPSLHTFYSPLKLRLFFLVCVVVGTAGCQAHKINTLRVEPPLSAVVNGAEIEIGTIHSGHPYPPPRFPVDASGSVSFPHGEWVNAGSYIVVHVGGKSVYFTPDQFRFVSRKTLVLRLSQSQMLVLTGQADLPPTEADNLPMTSSDELGTWDYTLEPQDFRLRQSVEDPPGLQQ